MLFHKFIHSFGRKPRLSTPQVLPVTTTLSQAIHSPRKQRWKHVKRLSSIVFLNILGMAALLATLYGFSTIDDLNQRDGWYKRLFNALAILCIALTNMGTGWLMQTELCNIVRWPILARQEHSLKDVDDLLMLSSLSACFGMICRHVKSWNINATTLVVAVVFVSSVLGKFCVAVFGFAFSMIDEPWLHQLSEVRTNVWPDSPLIYDTEDVDETVPAIDDKEVLERYLINGIERFSKRPQDGRFSMDPKNVLQLDRAVQSINGDSSSVSYSYDIQNVDSASGAVLESDRSVTTEASCHHMKGKQYVEDFMAITRLTA